MSPNFGSPSSPEEPEALHLPRLRGRAQETKVSIVRSPGWFFFVYLDKKPRVLYVQSFPWEVRMLDALLISISTWVGHILAVATRAAWYAAKKDCEEACAAPPNDSSPAPQTTSTRHQETSTSESASST